MVKYGKVIEYNGEYGLIQNKDGIVDFEKKDLSTSVKVGDIVEYREEKGNYLLLARNIKVVDEYEN